MDIQGSANVEDISCNHSQEIIEWVAINFPTTICLIAVIVGLLIIYIGYRYSGGIYNKKELTFSILISSILGVLTAPLLLKCAIWLGVLDNRIVLGVIFIIEVFFVAAVSSHTYEMVTVTAREAMARLPRD